MNFLKDKELNPKCRGLTLFSFLIKPVQRICKYPLFLKDLVKHIPPISPVHKTFSEALNKIEDVVDYVNERKRESESRQKIYDIQLAIEDLDEPLVEPRRKFQKEADVVLPNKEDSKKPGVDGKVFLFNDIIVFVAKVKGKKFPYSFRGKIPFSETTKVVVGVDSCEISDDKGMYHFKCETTQETNKWAQELKQITRPFQVRKLSSMKDAKKSLSTSVVLDTNIKKK